VALFNDPIGTLWAYLEKRWDFIIERIVEWLEETFPSLDEMIASLVPPDRGLPTIEEWWKGLREPETDEQIAYMALLETKLHQILDETFEDHPLTATEFATLLSPAPGRTET